MEHKTKVFCMGEDSESSIAGDIKTFLPVIAGQKHTIKGRIWVVTSVAKNIYGDRLAELIPD